MRNLKKKKFEKNPLSFLRCFRKFKAKFREYPEHY